MANIIYRSATGRKRLLEFVSPRFIVPLRPPPGLTNFGAGKARPWISWVSYSPPGLYSTSAKRELAINITIARASFPKQHRSAGACQSEMILYGLQNHQPERRRRVASGDGSPSVGRCVVRAVLEGKAGHVFLDVAVDPALHMTRLSTSKGI